VHVQHLGNAANGKNCLRVFWHSVFLALVRAHARIGWGMRA
jgi:hypothetical protein